MALEHGASKIRPGSYEQQDIPFKRKTKIGSFEWGGMWPDGDSSAVPENRPRLLLNTRRRSGEIRRRGGQKKLNTVALEPITGIQNFKIARPYTLYYVQDGCPSQSSTVGFSVGAFDYNQYPYAQPLLYLSLSSYNYTIVGYSDKLYGVKDDDLVEILLYRATFGGRTLDAAGSSMERAVLSLGGGLTYASSAISFDGYLFIMGIHPSGAGSCAVLKYDGVTLETDLASASIGTGLGLYRELLVLGYGGSPNYISVRNTSGTWSNVSPAAGTVVMLGPHTSVSYRDVFYFAGNTSDVWSYDGTTLAAIGTGTTGLNASAQVRDVCVHDGKLYVLWAYSNHSAAGIAQFDGTTWSIVKDLKAQFSTLNGATFIRSYNDVLVVGASTSTNGGCLFVSPPFNVAGTYVQHTLTSPSGQFFDVAVF